MAHQTPAKHGIKIFQTEARNPHLHEEKGGQRLLVEMRLPGLVAIYHSPLCEGETKEVIINELLWQDAIKPTEEPPKSRSIAPLKNIDLKKFANIMAEHVATCSALGEE